jgi:hypothetical protein
MTPLLGNSGAPPPVAQVGRQPSDALDGDSVRVGRQCLEILWIRGQHRTPRFGRGHNQGIYGRASTRTTPQKSCSSCETLTNLLDDVASFEESILSGIPSGVTLKAFDKNHRRNERWPQVFGAQREDQRCGGLRPLRETANSS